MAIVFPSKTGKKRSVLIDAFRILAWEEYRATNKEEYKDLEFRGYEVFEVEWKAHEIHDMTYVEIVALAKSLEFAENELLNLRSNYYAKKNAMAANKLQAATSKSNGNGNGNGNTNGNGSANGAAMAMAAQEFDNGDLF
ncbi:hypothetical protein [Microcoleus asticus]|uniref:Uncharacterized protein n=1 Tax=Microcoleus asticus IPMA8 TaxID=2563858 RepID=A0ABX2D648_9CYAN|nr:hypothetical protein [Microcoleus asticus]NQE38144.1 hypothetical protein [Microcoleus asticus IPMA8]